MGFVDRKAKVLAKVTPASMNQETSATLEAFKEREREESKRFQDATDSEYWVALVFATRADKEAFLREHGLARLGDKYLNGYEVAEVLLKRRGG